MGEGLSKVNKLNVTFDNPSLFPSTHLEKTKGFTIISSISMFFPAKRFTFADSFNYLNRNCFCIILKQIR